MKRLIFWNAMSLLNVLKQVVARRNASMKPLPDEDNLKRLEDEMIESKLVLPEVKEVIELPGYVAVGEVDPSSIDLGEKVETQLHDYIELMASFYQSCNPFHNFEHASHVTMSTKKLLYRIVDSKIEMDDDTDRDVNSRIHDCTYGELDWILWPPCLESALSSNNLSSSIFIFRHHLRPTDTICSLVKCPYS